MSRASRRNRALARQQLGRQLQAAVATNGGAGIERPTNGAQVALAARQFESYSGPIPHPDLLQRYEEIVPGSAARIIERMEKQSDHRMEMEKTAITGEVRRAHHGLICGAGIAVLVVGAGLAAILTGHDTAGAGMVTTVLAGGVASFIVGTVNRRKEREKKSAVQAGMRTK